MFSKTSNFQFFFISTLGIVLAIPIMLFLLNSYYDRYSDWLKIRNKNSTVPSPISVETLEQYFIHPSNNLSRITIRTYSITPSIFTASLYDTDARDTLLRENTLHTQQGKDTVWEFEPIADSQSQEYVLRIDILQNAQENVRLGLYPTDSKNLALQINNEPIENASLAFYTESKFPDTKAKLATLYDRMQIFKPHFVQIMLVPSFILYLLAFGSALWYGLKRLWNT